MRCEPILAMPIFKKRLFWQTLSKIGRISWDDYFFRLIMKASCRQLLTVLYLNEKSLTSQPEALSDEGFHRTAAPVGSLAVFHFGTEQVGWRGQLKNHPVFC